MAQLRKKTPTYWTQPVNDNATIYISWGDTDLSFDFHCKCGARPCGGGEHCLYVKCPKCDRVYALPIELVVKEVFEPLPHGNVPIIMED